MLDACQNEDNTTVIAVQGNVSHFIEDTCPEKCDDKHIGFCCKCDTAQLQTILGHSLIDIIIFRAWKIVARPCSPSCIIEYLAVDTGGYMFPNSYHALNAVSMGAFSSVWVIPWT